MLLGLSSVFKAVLVSPSNVASAECTCFLFFFNGENHVNLIRETFDGTLLTLDPDTVH